MELSYQEGSYASSLPSILSQGAWNEMIGEMTAQILGHPEDAEDNEEWR